MRHSEYRVFRYKLLTTPYPDMSTHQSSDMSSRRSPNHTRISEINHWHIESPLRIANRRKNMSNNNKTRYEATDFCLVQEIPAWETEPTQKAAGTDEAKLDYSWFSDCSIHPFSENFHGSSISPKVGTGELQDVQWDSESSNALSINELFGTTQRNVIIETDHETGERNSNQILEMANFILSRNDLHLNRPGQRVALGAEEVDQDLDDNLWIALNSCPVIDPKSVPEVQRSNKEVHAMIAAVNLEDMATYGTVRMIGYNVDRKPIPGTFFCSSCTSYFGSVECLDRHMKQKHIVDLNKVRICHICQTKCKSKTNLTRHIATCHDETKQQTYCQFCPASFSSKSCLNKHINAIHFGEGDEFGICIGMRKAGKDFTSKKNFDCKICLSSHNHKRNLTRHVKSVHLGIHDFPCACCNMTFTTRNNLEVHWRQHHVPHS